MRKTLLAIAAASGLATAGFAELGFAQDTATPPNADQTKHAVSPDTGKAKSTPDTTQIPGSSTTGNATGPAGGSGPAQGQTGAATGTAGSRVVPSPAQ
jgi:hypothetical protein